MYLILYANWHLAGCQQQKKEIPCNTFKKKLSVTLKTNKTFALGKESMKQTFVDSLIVEGSDYENKKN